jgi:hypothetical protein
MMTELSAILSWVNTGDHLNDLSLKNNSNFSVLVKEQTCTGFAKLMKIVFTTENEMDTKHTPGQWLYHKETNQVHVKNVATVAEVTPHYMSQIADGKLIAAAPLLLGALQMAFDRDLTYLSDAAVISRQDVAGVS